MTFRSIFNCIKKQKKMSTQQKVQAEALKKEREKLEAFNAKVAKLASSITEAVDAKVKEQSQIVMHVSGSTYSILER